jgi:hypothetical protein
MQKVYVSFPESWPFKNRGQLHAKFKWNACKVKTPITWADAYTDSEFQVISNENFLEFLI